MVHITLYKDFHKKPNSTKQPVAGQTDLAIEGYIKDKCGMVNPVIQFKRFTNDAVPGNFSYAYITEFNRFYYVNDWFFSDGMWEAHMTVDVLATFKTSIGNTSAYIERTSNATYQDGGIADKLYPAKTHTMNSIINFAPIWKKTGLSNANYTYIIGVVGSGYPDAAVVYYALSRTQMGDLLSFLFSNGYYTGAGFDQMTLSTAKAMYNPLQYITSCFYFPIDINDIIPFTLRLEDIDLGPFPITSANKQGYLLGDMAVLRFSNDIDLSLAAHPQASSRGSYLNYAPYSRWTLFIPPFGTIPIDTSYFQVQNGDHLYLEYILDGATGKGRLIVCQYEQTGTYWAKTVIGEYQTLFGIPVELAQISVDYLQAASTTLSTIAGAATTAAGIATANPFMAAGGLAMTLNSVGNALESAMPQLMTKGANGSAIAFPGVPGLSVQCFNMVDDYNADLGRPCCRDLQISTVGTGGYYVKCAEVNIDFVCLNEEKDDITGHLLSGFFFE